MRPNNNLIYNVHCVDEILSRREIEFEKVWNKKNDLEGQSLKVNGTCAVSIGYICHCTVSEILPPVV